MMPRFTPRPPNSNHVNHFLNANASLHDLGGGVFPAQIEWLNDLNRGGFKATRLELDSRRTVLRRSRSCKPKVQAHMPRDLCRGDRLGDHWFNLGTESTSGRGLCLASPDDRPLDATYFTSVSLMLTYGWPLPRTSLLWLYFLRPIDQPFYLDRVRPGSQPIFAELLSTGNVLSAPDFRMVRLSPGRGSVEIICVNFHPFDGRILVLAYISMSRGDYGLSRCIRHIMPIRSTATAGSRLFDPI
jgi:hypothetical protein